MHMIKSYADKVTKQLANGEVPKRVPKQVAQRTLMRLVQLDNAVELFDLRFPQSNRLGNYTEIAKGSTALGLMTNGASVLITTTAMLTTLNLLIITRRRL
jgi:plasmid maintenance system killer protein